MTEDNIIENEQPISPSGLHTITLISQFSANKSIMRFFSDRVETDEAREALRTADEVSDLILFHKKVRKNGISMMKPIED